jgi:hypothetical protein
VATLLFVFLAVVLALPIIAVIETGFVVTRSDQTRRALYALAAVWYAAFLILLAHGSPIAAWVYAIPQGLVTFVYVITKFRAAPSHRR